MSRTTVSLQYVMDFLIPIIGDAKDHYDHMSAYKVKGLGQLFSLDGKTVLVRGQLLRKWFRCTTTDGRVLRVAPTARVHTLYDKPKVV